MTKEELLVILERCSHSSDFEVTHGDADEALILFINDPDITFAYGKVVRWCA